MISYFRFFTSSNAFLPLHTTELLEVLKRFIPDKIQQKETEEQEEILPIKSLMPEIDCTIGIRNIGGNIEKYHEILQVYYREMSQMLEVLQDYANEDLEQFRISVHGIKGSSRNIGAEDLADEALQLEELAKEGVSGVVAGFTAKELLTALAVALARFQEGRPFFVNCYPRVVTENGSPQAQKLVEEMMEPCDSEWRGLGVIKGSGMRLQEEWSAFDARKKYKIPLIQGKANPACRCGDVLQGKCKPSDCKVFGKVCTPQHPIGACMVSGEGACSAYYMYGEAEKMK